jgi:RNA polymerase primary sigma factor
MNVYFVNRHSTSKGPFDLIDKHREQIIKVGDVCLHDYTDGVDFLFVCSSDNTWNACKKVGTGSNDGFSEQGDTLLFSFDGLHRRNGYAHILKQLSDCYREKVIVDFFSNAVDILKYKRDFWDLSLFSRFFASSQELITRTEFVDKGGSSIVENVTKQKIDIVADTHSTKEERPLAHADDVQLYILNDFNNKEFKKLLNQYRKGDRKALEIIVKRNQKLVTGIAKSYRDQGVEYEDLVQEGNIGFLRAIDRFNPYRNVQFPAYAKWFIHQSLILALRRMQSSIKITDRQITLYKKVRRSLERFEQENEYEPSATEIDIDEDIDIEEISLFISLPDSLHELTTSFNDWDKYPSNDSSDDSLMKESQTHYLNTILGKLTKREASILRHVYGIGVKIESLSDIGNCLGLTRERVRQISVKAVKRLREIVESRKGTTGGAESSLQEENEFDAPKTQKPLITRKQEENIVFDEAHSPVVRQKEPIKQDYSAKVEYKPTSSVVKKDSRKWDQTKRTVKRSSHHNISDYSDYKVGDHFYYKGQYCTVRMNIENGKYSKILVEYLNGDRDIISYNITKKTSETPSRKPNKTKGHTVSENPKSLSLSTSLKKLEQLGLITKKQYKHCLKRDLRTIEDVKKIIEKYHLTPDSARFTKYTLDIWFFIASLSDEKSEG